MDKRFTLETVYVQRDERYCIRDNETGDNYGFASWRSDLSDVCELLNRLNDELEWLRERRYD